MRRFLRNPVVLAIGIVVTPLILLVGYFDHVFFMTTSGLVATVNTVPLPPFAPGYAEYRAAYVIRLSNHSQAIADRVALTVSDAVSAYRDNDGRLDSLPRSNGHFQVGAILPGKGAVLWAFARTGIAEDRRSAVQVHATTEPVTVATFYPFEDTALFVILHLAQILIVMIVIEGLGIGVVLQLVGRARIKAAI